MSQANRTPRPILALIAILGVPTFIMVDTALACARGWRLLSRLDLACFLFFTLLWVVGLAAWVIPPTRRRLARNAAQLVLLTGALVVVLAIAEVALHFMSGANLAAQKNLRPPNQHYVFQPREAIMPGIHGDSNYRTNSLGIRGEDWPARDAAYRILCIGGSSCECAYLDDTETWPNLLGRLLNQPGATRKVWVGNAGISGATSIDHLDLVETCDAVRRVDCAIFFIGLNDFQAQLTGILLDREAAPLWRRSSLWNLIFLAYANSKIERGMMEDVNGTVYETRREKRRKAKIVDELPDLTEPLQAYRDRIERIAAVCRGYGVRPIFVTQPIAWDTRLSPAAKDRLLLGMSNRPDGAYYSIAKLREGEDRYNAALLETCKSLGAESIDASSLNGDERWYYDDCHFNEAGARQLAELIAKYFSKHPIQ